MKKVKKQPVQSEEIEQPVEEPKEIETPAEEAVEEPIAEEAVEASTEEETAEPVDEKEPKQKKGMPRFVKFLIFELIALIIVYGTHFCLLEFVLKTIDLHDFMKWSIANTGGLVAYLVFGYSFSHLIVFNNKGRLTFLKFLLIALVNFGLMFGLAYLGVTVNNMVFPAEPLSADVAHFSINHILTHEGQAMYVGFGILALIIILTILFSFLAQNFFVFRGKVIYAKEDETIEETEVKEEESEELAQASEEDDEVKEEESKDLIKSEEDAEAEEESKAEEEKPEEPKEEEKPQELKEKEYITHASFRQIVREEMSKYFSENKKIIRRSQAQNLIDEGFEEYEKQRQKKESK